MQNEEKAKRNSVVLGFLISLWLLGMFAASLEDVIEVFIICFAGAVLRYLLL